MERSFKNTDWSDVYTLGNVRARSNPLSPVKRQRVTGSNSVCKYRLLEEMTFLLSNGDFITIPQGFEWDLSSVPRILWWLLPPDGDAEIGTLIHDYLYVTKLYSREFADKEMLIWSKVTSGTQNLLSLRNLDNYVRYYGVRLGGWYVWNKRGPLQIN